ncbi:MAG: CBS domain-containing protein [Nitrospirae bacterium]|nr:CBS domain-containing protein [Nitrospirota bacterium]
MIPVKRVMARNIVTVDKQTTAMEVAGIMDAKNVGSVLVVDKADGKFVGIVTERDIVRKVVAKGLDGSSYLVKGVMSSPLVTIESTKTIFEAGDLMDQKKVRHLAVTEGSEVVGIVSIRDLINPSQYDEEAW